MAIGPTLETDRLILRPPEAQDLDGFAEMMADEEAARYVGGVMPRETVWRTLCTMTGAWTITGYSMWSVIEKSTGSWVGRLGPWYPEGWPDKEIGWGLSRSAWGKGYATEGAAAAMDYVFDTLGWTSVIHCIDTANLGSIKVAERLGSPRIGEAQGPPPFEHLNWDVYGQSAEDWRAR